MGWGLQKKLKNNNNESRFLSPFFGHGFLEPSQLIYFLALPRSRHVHTSPARFSLRLAQ